MLIIFTGCNKDKKEYVTETNTPTDSVGSDISMTSVAEKVGVDEELWEETVDDATLKKIYADVIVPDVTGMKVIDVEKVDYTRSESLKEEFLNKITNALLYNYGEGYYIKEEYEAHIDTMERLIQGMEEEGSEADSMYYESYNELLEAYENAPDEYIEISDFSGNEYLFTSPENGLNYVVSFYTNDDNNYGINIELQKKEELVDANGQRVQFNNINYHDFVLPEDNKCIFSEEEAFEKANDFISKFVIGEFELYSTHYIEYCFLRGNIDDYDYTEEEIFVDGYRFTFRRKIDGIWLESYLYSGSDVTSAQAEETYGYVTEGEFLRDVGIYEEISINVSSQGVVSFTYDNPLTVTEVVHDSVNLLSYDKIKQVFLQEIYNKSYYERTSFMYLELTYYLDFNKDTDKLTIIPVWRLSNKDSKEVEKAYDPSYSYVLINAMDGSVINVGEQILEPISKPELNQ